MSKLFIMPVAAAVVLFLSSAIQAQTFGVSDKHFDQIDRNDNGQVSKRELRRANILHKRIDVNDDGRIGKRERRYARNVRNNADLNNDGHIGKVERHVIRHRLNSVDRRH